MKARKMIVAFLVAALMVVGAPAAFAMHGFGDTLQDAVELYSTGAPDYKHYTMPIDSINDNDWYLIDFTDSDQNEMGAHVTLSSEQGAVYDFQLIETDRFGSILKVMDYSGESSVKGAWPVISKGHKLYMRVFTRGYDGIGKYYTLTFKRTI